MRTRWLGYVLCIGLLAWLPRAQAASEKIFDGNELLRRCTVALRTIDAGKGNMAEQVDVAQCHSYILGFADGYSVGLLLPGSFCPPFEWRPTVQLMRMVVAWMQKHPQVLHLHVADVLRLAYGDAFPCTPPSEKK